MIGKEEFEGLSQEEQVARLELLGRAALAQYGVDVQDVKPLVHAENTTYRVDGADGAFCLRIHRPGYQNFTSIHSELEWLSALRRDTDLLVPDPRLSVKGELVVRSSCDEVPEERNCVLFRWLEGEFHRDNMTPADFHQLGRVTALLHEHALQWDRPADFTRHSLNELDSYTEASDEPLRQPSSLISDEDRRRVERIGHESRELMRQVGKAPDVYGLIHADLHRGNVLFEGDQIKIIDFDDCGFGFYLYDFAATFAFQLSLESYEEAREAFFRGYEAVRPLPPRTRELMNAFLRFRLYGLVRWVLSRGDNPRLRETGGEFVAYLMNNIRLVSD
jgi:Ser/Thr protein kinase RdoA (MazF antagonist)